MSLKALSEEMTLLRNTAENLQDLAQTLYENSSDFPAVNRNAKRIIASIELVRINLEEFDQ